jgi:hypothetical protein
MSTNAIANFAARPPNLGGRPKGARGRLTNKLIDDLSEIWHTHGPDCLRKMAMREPGQLAKLAYATLPRDVLVSIEHATIPGGLEPDDWAMLMRVLTTIKAAIPPGCSAPPAEVFAVIETSLRERFAREIAAN